MQVSLLWEASPTPISLTTTRHCGAATSHRGQRLLPQTFLCKAGAAVWLPTAKWAGWLASGLFLATVFYLAVVALFAVTPLLDLKLAMGLR